MEEEAATLARVGEDPAAAAVLVRRHQAVMTRFVSRMLGADDPGVDDVVQKAFIAAFAHPQRYDGRSSVQTWLLGIAHNTARMTLRSRVRRRQVVELFGVVQSLWPRTAAPEVEAQELGGRLRAALDTLDPDRRAVFLLTEAEGFTAAEVAEIVGAPAGTVRRWRVEARDRLRPLLADLREVAS